MHNIMCVACRRNCNYDVVSQWIISFVVSATKPRYLVSLQNYIKKRRKKKMEKKMKGKVFFLLSLLYRRRKVTRNLALDLPRMQRDSVESGGGSCDILAGPQIGLEDNRLGRVGGWFNAAAAGVALWYFNTTGSVMLGHPSLTPRELLVRVHARFCIRGNHDGSRVFTWSARKTPFLLGQEGRRFVTIIFVPVYTIPAPNFAPR